MALFDKISKDLVLAMKDKNTAKVSVLRLLRSALKNKAIEIKKDRLEDADVLTVLKKQAKQHRDSIESFKKGGRQDLVQKEETEFAILKEYLPEQLSTQKIEEVVQKVIDELDAKGPQAMGAVMKKVMEELKGRADGRQVSSIVNTKLRA